MFSLRVHVPEFCRQIVVSSLTIFCMKWLAFPAVLVAGFLCAAPAGADGEQFRTDLSGTGIPPESYLTLEMWANTACDLQPQLGLSDAEVVRRLPGDVADKVTLSPQQAQMVWWSAKLNLC